MTTFKNLKINDTVYHAQTRPIDDYACIEKYKITNIVHKNENSITIELNHEWEIHVNPEKSIHKRNKHSYITADKESITKVVEILLKKSIIRI